MRTENRWSFRWGRRAQPTTARYDDIVVRRMSWITGLMSPLGWHLFLFVVRFLLWISPVIIEVSKRYSPMGFVGLMEIPKGYRIKTMIKGTFLGFGNTWLIESTVRFLSSSLSIMRTEYVVENLTESVYIYICRVQHVNTHPHDKAWRLVHFRDNHETSIFCWIPLESYVL